MTTATLSLGVFPLVRELISLTKPRVTLLVILTCGAGMAVAPASMAPIKALLLAVGTVLVVGSANAFNCLIERDSDALMSRTRDRALPAGRLSAGWAFGFAALLALLSLPALLQVNLLTGALGMLALFLYVCVYTPMKSRSPAALVVGSVPGAIPPLMGWSAVTGTVEPGGLVLFGILFLWQMPHVIGLSCFRMEDYQRAGTRVLPAVRGVGVAKWHALLWALLLVPVAALLVPLGLAGPVYGAASVLCSAAYVAACLVGFSSDSGPVWGRRLFLVSLSYLPALFTALLVDAAL